MTNRYILCITALLSASIAASGCSESSADSAPSGTESELGNGTMSYLCEDNSDIACDAINLCESYDVECAENNTVGDSMVVPVAIATGARFGMLYSSDGSYYDDYYGSYESTALQNINAASEQFILKLDSTIFEAIAPGTVAFLVDGADNRIDDFYHIQIEDIASIEINAYGDEWDGDRITTIELTEGTSALLRAIPRSATGYWLSGSLPCYWSSDDESVASISSNATDNSIVVEAIAPGTATLTIELDEIETTINVVVEEIAQ